MVLTTHRSARPPLRMLRLHLLRILMLASAGAAGAEHAHAQGCVAIKQMDGSAICSLDGHALEDPTRWTFISVNYSRRW